MADKVLYQTDDDLSQTNLAASAKRQNAEAYVERGLELQNYDGTGLTVDVSAGHAIISAGSDAAYDVFPDARSGVSLTDSAVNSVYVVIDPTTQDDVTVEARTSGTPANPHLKIGEVDTSADSTTDVARDPDGSFGSVSADELVGNHDRVVSSTSELQSLPDDVQAGETVLIDQPDTPYRPAGWPGGTKFGEIDVDEVTILCESRYAGNGEALAKPADGADIGGLAFGLNSAVTNITTKQWGWDGNQANQDDTVLRCHGLLYHNVAEGEISHCYATQTHPYHQHNSGGSGISVGYQCSDIDITYNLLEDIGDRGIETAQVGGTIMGNRSVNGFDRGISLQHRGLNGNDWVNAQDVIVTGNHIKDMPEGSCIKARGLDGHSGTAEQSPKNIIVTNNHCLGNHRSGVSFQNLTHAAERITVTDNQCINNTQDVIVPGILIQTRLESATGNDSTVVVSDNTVEGYGTSSNNTRGIAVDKFTGPQVRDNVVKLIYGTGIWVNSSAEGSVVGNTVRDATTKGIEVGNHGDSQVSDNQVFAFDRTCTTGIIVNGGGNQQVTDNICKQMSTNGILSQGASAVEIDGNKIRDGGVTTSNGVNVDSNSSGIVVIHNDLRGVSGTALSDSGTGTITDPVSQDKTSDYNLV
jgi:parallel beta-helix repeat protein